MTAKSRRYHTEPDGTITPTLLVRSFPDVELELDRHRALRLPAFPHVPGRPTQGRRRPARARDRLSRTRRRRARAGRAALSDGARPALSPAHRNHARVWG